MLTSEFFNRDAKMVAKDLLGKVLQKNHDGIWLSALIIETEAYYRNEKGSHASLGYTPKRRALFMEPGTIYMYYARGSDSFNISCKGEGNAVLIKSGYPYLHSHLPKEMLSIMYQLNPQKNKKERRSLQKLCAGQTLLCKSLGLKVKEWDQKTFSHETLRINTIDYQPEKIIRTTRLGIPKGRDEHLMLRFVDAKYAPFCTSNPINKKLQKYNYKVLRSKATIGENLLADRLFQG